MSLVVDSSALFALLDTDDPNHAAATRYWDEADRDLVTHAYVIIETVVLIRRRWGCHSSTGSSTISCRRSVSN